VLHKTQLRKKKALAGFLLTIPSMCSCHKLKRFYGKGDRVTPAKMEFIAAGLYKAPPLHAPLHIPIV
jgi:hypothetical protein